MTDFRAKRPFQRSHTSHKAGGAAFHRLDRPRVERAGDVQLIWGIHAVEEALANPRRQLIRLQASENAWRRLLEGGRTFGLEPEFVRPSELDRQLPQDAVHQGVLLEARPLEPVHLDELPDTGLVLVLDQITDPHNVGAILRTAAAFGVTALVMTNRHSPEATGTLAKSASGALEHVPFCIVQNLSRALAELRQRGFLCVGLDSEGGEELEGVPLRAPLALVLGAEGKGLRHLTREGCDHLARIALPGAICSLNVSNAAALTLYIAQAKLKI